MNKGREAIRKAWDANGVRYRLVGGLGFFNFQGLLRHAREMGYIGSPALLHLRYSKGITDPARLFANPDPKKAAQGKKASDARQEKNRADVQAALERLGPPRRY